VLAAEITPTETPAELLETPVVTIAPPAPATNELAQTVIPEPKEPITWENPAVTVPAPAPIELPKTASPFPLVGLGGVSAVALSFLLRVLRKAS